MNAHSFRLRLTADHGGKLLKIACVLALAACAVPALLTRSAHAQEVRHADTNTPAPQHAGSARQLAEGSREAAGEDDAAEFKQSASVQLLARVTGLSLQHAYWVSVILNFVIIAGLIFWFGKKSLPGLFQGRTATIQKAISEARKASEEANRRLSDIESRLARLDTEIGAMQAAAEKDAAAEEERIRAAAAEDVRKVVQSAEQEIAAAAKQARRELTAYAADLAVALATKQMRIDAATDEALVRGFARQLSSNGETRKDGR